MQRCFYSLWLARFGLVVGVCLARMCLPSPGADATPPPTSSVTFHCVARSVLTVWSVARPLTCFVTSITSPHGRATTDIGSSKLREILSAGTTIPRKAPIVRAPSIDSSTIIPGNASSRSKCSQYRHSENNRTCILLLYQCM